MLELKLTPSQMRPVLAAMIAERIPVIVEGEPGIGKSGIVEQVCAEELGGIECRNWMRASQMDAVDIRGLPKLNGGDVMTWQSPDWFPIDPESVGVLFFDELGQGTESVQAAMMQVVLEYRLGNRELPPGWAIVAATNLETDRAGVHRMMSALSRRFTHLRLVPDVDDWCKWALRSGVVRPEMVAYIRFRPEALHEFNSKLAVDPNPRAWERCSKLVGMGFPDTSMLAALAGTVGEQRAVELMTFLKTWKSLPAIEGILLNPDTAPVPEEVSVKFAVMGALAYRASATNFQAVLTYAERVGEELSVFLVRDAVAREPRLQATTPFIQWASTHSDLML